MRDAIRRTHVVPVFGGGRQPLQTVYVGDVCEAIARVIERGLAGGFNVAEHEPFTFADFLRRLARRLQTRCVLVPMPFAPVLFAVRSFERLGVPFPLRSESLLGIKALRRVPVAEDLRRLDLTARTADESLAGLVGARPKTSWVAGRSGESFALASRAAVVPPLAKASAADGHAPAGMVAQWAAAV